MKRRKYGFTIVELLTSLVIIATLVALLIPALGMVRRIAKETAQKAQLTTIEMAFLAFKNDYGDYPKSAMEFPPYYGTGTQRFAEALLGWDLMGFHPKSSWRNDGREDWSGSPNEEWTYDPDRIRINPIDSTPVTLTERRGPYLDVATTNVFRLGNISPAEPGLFNDPMALAPETYVICDVFGVRKMILPPTGTTAQPTTVRAGTPILYYRADRSKNTIENVIPPNRIYNVFDNVQLLTLRKMTKDGTPAPLTPEYEHPLNNSTAMYQLFYDRITDPKVPSPWPHRPDSYILISAGFDGLYGTSDDICNFER